MTIELGGGEGAAIDVKVGDDLLLTRATRKERSLGATARAASPGRA
jgi:uncharacterized protein YjlB